MHTVVGWATAKSRAAGCGASHDRTTSLRDDHCIRVTEDAMNVGKRDEARETADIMESPGFTHPGIVASFSRRKKRILAYETRYFLPPKSVKPPARFHEEPSTHQPSINDLRCRWHQGAPIVL
jgi:hypothetical protein